MKAKAKSIVNPCGSKWIRRWVKAKTGEKMSYPKAKEYYDSLE